MTEHRVTGRAMHGTPGNSRPVDWARIKALMLLRGTCQWLKPAVRYNSRDAEPRLWRPPQHGRKPVVRTFQEGARRSGGCEPDCSPA
jgi:hypothetical protein